MTKAILRNVRFEVPYTRNGRPSYKMVEGYQVISPEGSQLFPYMRKLEAISFCKQRDWKYEKAR